MCEGRKRTHSRDGEGVKVSLDEVIEEVNKGKGYAYLGILELLDPFHEKTKTNMTTKAVEMADTILPKSR